MKAGVYSSAVGVKYGDVEKYTGIEASIHHKPPCIANDDRINTSAFTIPHVKGIHVDILK